MLDNARLERGHLITRAFVGKPESQNTNRFSRQKGGHGPRRSMVDRGNWDDNAPLLACGRIRRFAKKVFGSFVPYIGSSRIQRFSHPRRPRGS